MESDMNNLDLACAARLGRLLEGLIDHRAVGVGIRHAEHHRQVRRARRAYQQGRGWPG